MTHITHADAKKFKCPVARTFDGGKRATCDGDACILWRWKAIPSNDHRFISAINRTQTDMHATHEALEAKKDKPTSKAAASFHKAAVAKVAAQPWDFMFMTDEDRGYCGLGSAP